MSAQKVSAADVQECERAWLAVLDKYRASRPLMESERLAIARAIQMHGKEFVLLAFLGAMYEPASEGYKPHRFLSLKRVLDPVKFDRFVNLGAMAKVQLDAQAVPS